MELSIQCCVLGFHNSQSGSITTAKTWIYTAHTEANTFVGNVILDVQPLSHEVSEWLNDPFVGAGFIGGINLIPPAVLPNSGGGCIINFETGDPLEFTLPAAQFTQVTNGTTYHLQDESSPTLVSTHNPIVFRERSVLVPEHGYFVLLGLRARIDPSGSHPWASAFSFFFNNQGHRTSGASFSFSERDYQGGLRVGPDLETARCPRAARRTNKRSSNLVRR